MYNVFRLTGDGLHCLALMVLFGKMNQTRSCAGATNTSSLLASSAACWLWFGGLLALPRAERLAVRRDLAEDGVPVRDRLLLPLCVPARRRPPARPLAPAPAPAAPPRHRLASPRAARTLTARRGAAQTWTSSRCGSSSCRRARACGSTHRCASSPLCPLAPGRFAASRLSAGGLTGCPLRRRCTTRS